MAANGDHIIDIIIETADHTGPGMQRAADRLLAFDRRIQQTSQRLRQLTNRGHRLTLDLIDNVTPAGSRINRALRRLADRAWSIPLRLNDRITSGIREAETRLLRLTGRAYTVTVNLKDNVTKGIKGAVDSALSSVTGFSGGMLASAGIGYGVYDAVNTYKNFEQQMSSVAAITGAKDKKVLDENGNEIINPKTGEALTQYDQLIAKAKEMGATTQFTAQEAGKAFEYMGMAGWDASTMLQAIPAVLNLAAASGEQLGTVSDIVTDAMTAMHIDATTENVAHFSDVLAATATNANTNVAMMGEAFKYAAPLAGNLGYSIDDVSVALGLMANSGIKATQAGTALRSIFTRLSAEPKAAGTAMDILGIKMTKVGEDGKETMKSFGEMMTEMRASFKTADSAHIIDFAEKLTGMKGIKDKDKLAAMLDKMKANGGELSETDKIKFSSMLAGQEAMSGLLAILTSSDKDFEKLTGAIRDSHGAAEKMAKIKMDNLAGDITTLGSAWEGLQLTLMEGAPAQGIRDFVKFATDEIQKLNGLFQDGIDISDFGKVAMDVITQLKDKFLELDGVGSILAGGSLAGGIGLITSKTLKLVDAIKNAAQTGGTGGTSGGFSGGGAGQQSVGTMNVRAGVVNIHGSQAPGGGGIDIPDIPDIPAGESSGSQGSNSRSGSRNGNPPSGSHGGGNPPGGNPPPAGSGRMARFGKVFGGIGTAISLASSAYDVYATGEYNKQMSEEADWRIQEADRNSEEKHAAFHETQAAYQRGEIGLDEYHKAFSDMQNASKEQHDALDYKDRVEQQNTDRQNQSIGGMIGGVVGGALGGLAGSAVAPGVGTAVGGMAGAAIGTELGEMAGANFSSMAEKASEAWQAVKDEAANTMEWLGNIVGNEMEYVGNSFSSIKDPAQNEWDYVKNTAGEAVQGISDKWDSLSSFVGNNVWTPIEDAAITSLNFIVGLAATIGGMIGEAIAPLVDWMNKNVWTPIKDYASQKWEEISATVSEKVSSMTEGLGEIAAYFDENVWTPINDKASEVWTSISESPGEAVAYIGEIWSGLSSWFAESVWTPLGELANSAWGVVSSTATAAWDAIAAYFSPAASWFDSTVWQPISSAVGTVQSAITGAFETAWGAVTGLWASAGAWFEQNVIAPVKSAFNKITSLGSSITGLTTSGNTEKDAAGTIAFTPRQAIIGEAGPEAVIPLGSGMRSRTLDLWEKVGSYLGQGNGAEENSGAILSAIQSESERYMPPVPGLPDISAMAENAFVAEEESPGKSLFSSIFSAFEGLGDNETSGSVPVTAPAIENAKGGNGSQEMKIDIGGMSLSVEINGGDGNVDTNSIMDTIKQNFSKLADDVAMHIAEKTSGIWNNQPLTV